MLPDSNCIKIRQFIHVQLKSGFRNVTCSHILAVELIKPSLSKTILICNPYSQPLSRAAHVCDPISKVFLTHLYFTQDLCNGGICLFGLKSAYKPQGLFIRVVFVSVEILFLSTLKILELALFEARVAGKVSTLWPCFAVLSRHEHIQI
jgi:hypothetical protein